MGSFQIVRCWGPVVEMLTNHTRTAQQLQRSRNQTNCSGIVQPQYGNCMAPVQFLTLPQGHCSAFLQPGKKCEMTWSYCTATLQYNAAVLWPWHRDFWRKVLCQVKQITTPCGEQRNLAVALWQQYPPAWLPYSFANLTPYGRPKHATEDLWLKSKYF